MRPLLVFEAAFGLAGDELEECGLVDLEVGAPTFMAISSGRLPPGEAIE